MRRSTAESAGTTFPRQSPSPSPPSYVAGLHIQRLKRIPGPFLQVPVCICAKNTTTIFRKGVLLPQQAP
jgi:hypothetical protein